MHKLQRFSQFGLIQVFVVLVLVAGLNWNCAGAAIPEVGRYRVFEASVENDKLYGNKFNDVELRAQYTAPSGRKIDFIGFFDGDGVGGGNATTGDVWKLRFMPDERRIGTQASSFTPTNRETDWVLLLRTQK